MASLITERDLNSEELINALKCIETESVDLVRYQLLLDENQRLRNELLKRHQTRLHELMDFEKKKNGLIKIVNEMKRDSQEMADLKTKLINANQDFDHILDVIFQLTCAITTGDVHQNAFTHLKELNKMVLQASRKLYFIQKPDFLTVDSIQTNTALSMLDECRFPSIDEEAAGLKENVKILNFGDDLLI